MALVKIFLFLLPFHLLFFEAKSECPESFQCGKFSMGFPFTNVNNSGCGLVTVDGCDSGDENPMIHLRDGSLGYAAILENISITKFLVEDYLLEAQLNNRSCFSFEYLSPLQTPSISFTFSPNLTLFPCSNEYGNRLKLDDHFQNYSSIDCGIYFVYYKNSTTVAPTFGKNDIPVECQLVQLPVKSTPDSDDLFSILSSEYTLEWNVSEACLSCFHGGGQCLTDNDGDFYCNKGNHAELKKILFIGGMAIAALTSTLIIVYVFIRRKHAKAKQEYEKDIELFLRNNGNLVPMRYKYSSIKKLTNSFSENLGKGGFGSVYKGKFPDGRLVAVKILNELNGNGEDFMNEVASISRTSHINIVALLGFCFEGPKRALIFDFMPNGSLEKLIGNTSSSAANLELGWDKLYEIALGVARGLEYLHQGCNTRILHLDIKPQNILLDKNLNPRISDFGLAKLCPNRSSIVSMMVARGTIGYIAPEVFSRNFGEVSYKSDVYSYGMLVLEMVGGRKIIDRGDVDHTSEIYFPHYIYKQLEMDGDVIGTMNEDETQVAKRNLILVGLWCIQTNPKDRPSMTKVVEMLEGKSGALKIPPKPYLYSPPRSAAHVSSTSQSM